ncbi:MAG: hypothetical protein MASP_00800 [Candidatus Methanolliviera sp. GoM_asphalt]|nr:MAG: hypothetical protein MASP_00800 [Candidatus Methanolliviera sp. GoM_asphalt]
METYHGIFVLLLLSVSMASPIASAQLHDTLVKDQPKLPNELSNYYRDFRGSHYIDLLKNSGIGEKKEKDRRDLAVIENYMIIHDAGRLDLESSEIARGYLEETVIKPLKEEKSVFLQTGETMEFEDLDRLALAKLLYYYVRDDIYFPHPEEERGIERCFASVPKVGLLLLMSPEIIKFPCETMRTQHGDCTDKALLLSTLLKMEGYKVAIGSAPAMTVNTNGEYVWFGYHTYVLLKDEGWGVGRLELKEDIFGHKMGGRWIILDPIYSPRHFDRIQLLGGGKVLEFGDTPNWVGYKDEMFTPLNEVLFSYGLVNEEVISNVPPLIRCRR